MLNENLSYALNLLNRLKQAADAFQEQLNGFDKYRMEHEVWKDTLVLLAILSSSADDFSSEEWDFIEVLFPIMRKDNTSVFQSVRSQFVLSALPELSSTYCTDRIEENKQLSLFINCAEYFTLVSEVYSAFFPVSDEVQGYFTEFVEAIAARAK